MKEIPSITNLTTTTSLNAKTKDCDIDKLDVDKLVPVPVDLSKLSDVVRNDVVKNDLYNANNKNIILNKNLILLT